ncbi:MAG: 1-deoxy-D-xylulose-5-phosphate reductoisomerase [Candidatus Xiphinematobacter sp.]|nr:MAG: 1-deoxy-D-xylulose-5-phosphate reductoisomerase [Candidatus Xiphinematobacter sp.]QQY11215.1 MAG: 1-deoxy-D-xylulose-5-phosphate reductoisomerase [Candidatus Xiphinematobacter sp.]
MRKRRVVILGATGSIGDKAMQVARVLSDRIDIVGMSTLRNVVKMEKAIREFRPKAICVGDPISASNLDRAFGEEVRIFCGAEGLVDLVIELEADIVLVAITGTDGLRPALAAIEIGRNLALASKEILVMAGSIVTRAVKDKGVHLLPVDSEHNAIFQCLEGHSVEEVSRLILTCSGGPFRSLPSERLAGVTPEKALCHPTWRMGRKVTVDCATLFNKGLELIEAQQLFGVPISCIDVIIHPQSIVHSMVELIDGCMLAEMGASDMYLPIQHALMWPERVGPPRKPLNLATLHRLEFFAPRWDDFPALRLAQRAGECGGTVPAILNAANEVAVEAFLKGEIPFPRIWGVVEEVLDRMGDGTPTPDLGQILETDAEARRLAAIQCAASFLSSR